VENMAKRLTDLLQAKNGGNQSEMARYIGVTPQAVQKWMAGVTEPRGRNLEMAAEFLGVTPAHLKFGIQSDAAGGAEQKQADPVSGLRPGSFMRVEGADQDDPRLTIIPKLRLRLTAGLSGFEVEPEPYDGGSTTVPTDWIERNGYSRAKLIAITVRGESMEPTFYEGDLVVINTADIQPVAGAVYAVNYEGEPAIKRLARDAGRWWLVSDNVDQRRYYRQSFQSDTSQIIGRVVRKETERF
jgi:phage repressor protein C with HTH and peptisase S24 domain